MLQGWLHVLQGRLGLGTSGEAVPDLVCWAGTAGDLCVDAASPAGDLGVDPAHLAGDLEVDPAWFEGLAGSAGDLSVFLLLLV